ncbi:MAG: hypothetical protein QF569_17315 [Candidatus Poribacteria bacterium]|nr:hypothetical protein [Candidatus Poribacteria bacterium]
MSKRKAKHVPLLAPVLCPQPVEKLLDHANGSRQTGVIEVCGVYHDGDSSLSRLVSAETGVLMSLNILEAQFKPLLILGIAL